MLNELGVLLGVSYKIKRNKNHIYQWLRGVCFVPIIAPFQTLPKSTEINLKPVYCGFWPVFYLLLSTGLNRNQVTVGGISGGILCSVLGDAPNET